MTQTFSDRLRGIHAATIVPMTPDFEIDETRLADHVASVASTPGINGLLVNGHAGENFVLSLAEKQRVVELAREYASERLPDRLWRQSRIEPGGRARGGCAGAGGRGRASGVSSQQLGARTRR
ncbi:hypothetical protein ABIF35_007386 [Bradyrhizobium japonicum]|uniref:dihydrodipicolinate synthase family protein n=1 Tax=Bradyrhizobium diazoefficiens TaxID=1355477 RepID=UPI0034792BDA